MRLHGFLIGQTETLLAEVLRLNGPADATTSRFFRAHPKLGHGERGVIAEAVFAVLRRRMEFAHLAESGAGSPARRMALLGLMQTAGRTALKPFVSDSESKWLEHVSMIDPEALPLRIRLNLPDWIYQALSKRFEPAELAQLAAALNYPAPLDLRANPIKASRDDVLNALSKAGIEAGATPFAPFGVRVVGKPPLTKLDAFQHGWLEVQDEGSQLLCSLVAPKRGEMIVDFCAGAGGKTLALGAAMNNKGRIVAMDVVGGRLIRAKERFRRAGLHNIETRELSSERDKFVKRHLGHFDLVLVDAPCSGTGTWRRDPDKRWRQLGPGLPGLVPLQKDILESACRMVKPGGRLVYATCSLLPEENEMQVERFLDAHKDFEVKPAKDIVDIPGTGDFLKVTPAQHGTDGFFAAVLARRKGDA
jgi:16S rRNA (cytosine967-C5)-methyltransferase